MLPLSDYRSLLAILLFVCSASSNVVWGRCSCDNVPWAICCSDVAASHLLIIIILNYTRTRSHKTFNK